MIKQKRNLKRKRKISFYVYACNEDTKKRMKMRRVNEASIRYASQRRRKIVNLYDVL